ncbi:MAG: CDGSH iron-sulfur domain-containing protein [Candidatus Aenigmarchaeota archaeon]|nr:CDGSH iron-sulfur domain-containing protein [Candidatus Aenigmarchaeota archaeon]
MGSVEIEHVENGPYLVKKDGKVETALCRCGGSANKPFCDGAHSKISFKAKGGKTEVTKE